jgi:hypothetical protein
MTPVEVLIASLSPSDFSGCLQREIIDVTYDSAKNILSLHFKTYNEIPAYDYTPLADGNFLIFGTENEINESGNYYVINTISKVSVQYFVYSSFERLWVLSADNVAIYKGDTRPTIEDILEHMTALCQTTKKKAVV